MDGVKAWVAAMSLGVAAGASAQDAAALNTRSLAASCSACHGTDGRAIAGSAVPGLAGMAAGQLVERLKAFQRGERPSTVMQQIARGYSDAQIERLAAFFAAQVP
jgi:cytochrome c553